MTRAVADFRAAHPAPRRGLRREEAALYVGVSGSKFDEMVRDGRMPKPARVDGCVIWDVRKLDVACDEIFGDDGGPNPWD
jgi:predicted DNA-binding transcriptional regulator AlpA